MAYVAARPYFKKGHERITVYEFYPLPGDPTKAEIEEENKKQINQDMERAKQVQREYEQMNLIKSS